jgi:hypothetical protein
LVGDEEFSCLGPLCLYPERETKHNERYLQKSSFERHISRSFGGI